MRTLHYLFFVNVSFIVKVLAGLLLRLLVLFCILLLLQLYSVY